MLQLQSNLDMERREQVRQVIVFLTKHCSELKSSIYFVSEALVQISFEPKPETHNCCHRYFWGEQAKSAYTPPAVASEVCTCSVVDLICQTNKLLIGPGKGVTSGLMFTLFQSQTFKMNLGMAYIANMPDIMAIGDPQTLMAASTQIFPLEKCTIQIVRDPALVRKIASTLESLLSGITLHVN